MNKNCLILLFATAALSFAFPLTTSAQNLTRTDSTLIALRLNELKTRKADIQKQIETEDRKRNQTIEGVSAETMEQMNLAQDSICLELRSQLVEVELEIAEITPDKPLPAQFLQQYNRLRQSQGKKPEKK